MLRDAVIFYLFTKNSAILDKEISNEFPLVVPVREVNHQYNKLETTQKDFRGSEDGDLSII